MHGHALMRALMHLSTEALKRACCPPLARRTKSAQEAWESGYKPSPELLAQLASATAAEATRIKEMDKELKLNLARWGCVG
jgi:hypothetical protein